MVSTTIIKTLISDIIWKNDVHPSSLWSSNSLLRHLIGDIVMEP